MGRGISTSRLPRAGNGRPLKNGPKRSSSQLPEPELWLYLDKGSLWVWVSYGPHGEALCLARWALSLVTVSLRRLRESGEAT